MKQTTRRQFLKMLGAGVAAAATWLATDGVGGGKEKPINELA